MSTSLSGAAKEPGGSSKKDASVVAEPSRAICTYVCVTDPLYTRPFTAMQYLLVPSDIAYRLFDGLGTGPSLPHMIAIWYKVCRNKRSK